MSRNNKDRRRGSRKSGEFKTCEEGASFVRSETVRQVKKSEEGGGRTEENTASVRQLRGKIRELKSKMKVQEEGNEMLKAALIVSMSRNMYDNYDSDVKFEMEHRGIKNLEDYPLERKEDNMTNAKQEAIAMVATHMIYLTHPGDERKAEPSKLAVDTFGDVISFNGYEYKDMVKEEKDKLWDGMDYLFHFRLFCECREIDWKQAIEEGRNFHDYRNFNSHDKSRDYFTEKQILLGKPVRKGKEDYTFPEFP